MTHTQLCDEAGKAKIRAAAQNAEINNKLIQ